jgi:hypothetical protein
MGGECLAQPGTSQGSVHAPPPLTDRFCQHAKAADGEPQTDYFDEKTRGLALRVTDKGSKTWTWLFTLGGKRVRMTFGTYPATSLGAARTEAGCSRGARGRARSPHSPSEARDLQGHL